jgi:hypothetical protein
MPQSNALSSIDNSLVDECISTPTKQHIIRQLWGNEALIASNTRREPDFSAYWSYYSRQCREALHDNGRHVSARTHRDILEIIELLKGGHVRRDIRSLLCSKLSNTAAANGGYLLDGSINLAASLLLMVNCGNQPYGFSGRFQLNWEGRLEDVVGTYFKQPPVLGNEMIKLERVFNARSLEKIAGIKIVWTDNLMDHLRLTDDDSKVEIFHHASFLRAQKERLGSPRR